MRASLFLRQRPFFSLSLPQQTSPVSARLQPMQLQLSCMSRRQEGSLFLLMAMFPLLLKGSKLEHEKSCLLIKFAVCGGETLCPYNRHKQGAKKVFLYWSVVGQILQLPVGFVRRISMFISEGNELDQCFLWISLVKTTSLPKDQVM